MLDLLYILLQPYILYKLYEWDQEVVRERGESYYSTPLHPYDD